MKHKLFTTLLVMLMSTTGSNAFAPDYSISDINDDGITIYYKLINEGTELEVVCPEVSEYNGSYYLDTDNCYNKTAIHIPEKVDWMGNLPVTSIAAATFYNCTELVELTIPESVTSIGNYAFYGCSKLGEIDLPYGITRIGSGTFYGCTSLTSIEIPNSVTSIGDDAFLNCSNLTSIKLGKGITSIGDYIFSGCENLENIIVEEGNALFDSRNNCNALIETSSNTLLIGCKGTIIPNSINAIGRNAFACCQGLTEIDIPSSVETIGVDAFSGCDISTLNLSYGLRTIGKNAFAYCSELTSVILPNSVETIDGGAFMGSGLESVYIPRSVNNIALNPFAECCLLSSIQVDPSNPYYNSYNNCNAIIETNTGKLIAASKQTIVPSNVTCIGMAAFSFSKRWNGNPDGFDIASIILPEGLTVIEKPNAFWGLHIGKLVIPSTITTLELNCISYCTIDTLVITDIKAWCEAVEKWPINGGKVYNVYNNGNKIKDMIIPNGTNRIGPMAFAFDGFDSISSITIPSSVTEIGEDALSYSHVNTNLVSVFVEKEEPIALSDKICKADEITLYVPRGCKSVYEAANIWKDFKEIVEYDPNVEITMGSSGITTYSSNYNLDFTSVSGLKAYIASGFSPSSGELTMLRIYKVPACEGILLKGEAGSYEVPGVKSDFIYANLLVGVPTATTVSPTDGSYTNFILANDEVKGIGFYPLASAGEIGPNKAYLQLPTSILPAASRSLRMVFEDEEEDVTGINALNEKGALSNEKFFDLQGRRVIKPTRGLYIKDGKKIMVK